MFTDQSKIIGTPLQILLEAVAAGRVDGFTLLPPAHCQNSEIFEKIYYKCCIPLCIACLEFSFKRPENLKLLSSHWGSLFLLKIC